MGKLNRRNGSSSKETPPTNLIRLVPPTTSSEIKTTKLNRRTTPKTEETNEEQLKKDETTIELEWREKEVARVFREGRGRRGRPSRISEPLIRDMEVLARIGLSETAICESVRLESSTFMSWKKKNKEFRDRINEARECGKAVLINSIFGHGRKNWQAHAWMLERMHRNDFGANQKVELTGKGGGEVVFKVVYEDKKEGV